jgi:hypothetical protein
MGSLYTANPNYFPSEYFPAQIFPLIPMMKPASELNEAAAASYGIRTPIAQYPCHTHMINQRETFAEVMGGPLRGLSTYFPQEGLDHEPIKEVSIDN